VVTEEMCSEDKYRGLILQYVKAADLGIAGLRTEQEEYDDLAKKIWTVINEAMAEKSKIGAPPKRTKTLFQHRGKGESQVELESRNESDGTVAFFSLLGPVARTLESGGVFCVDELDSSLHPLLALELVRMFNDSRNPRGAQLIFNTHDTNLLDSSLLRRDQIWFTEKDSSGATHLYPLSDFKPRKNENLERGYLQGRYGAVPFLERDLVSQDKDD
jgi:AAA15 family ATPase/GTPase